MKTTFVKIAGVKCTLSSNGKLILELPQGMNGLQLTKWRSKYREQAMFKLL